MDIVVNFSLVELCGVVGDRVLVSALFLTEYASKGKSAAVCFEEGRVVGIPLF
jgi:hypothetical protein